MKNWIKIGLFWGLLMFVLMTLVFPYLNKEEITTKSILLGSILWMSGGFLFGYLIKGRKIKN